MVLFLRTIFILGVTIFVSHACTEFTLPFKLPDKEIERTVIVDITSQEAYLLDTETFQKEYGYYNTYNPKTSKTFINTTKSFSRSHSALGNINSSVVSGYIGQDTVTILSRPLTGQFGIVNKITGNDRPTITCAGYPYAGRIGFSKAKGGPTNLGSLFMGERDNKVLCMAAAPQSNHMSFGALLYEPKDLLAKVPSLASPEGLWKVKLDKFMIGSTRGFANLEATISTTLSGLSVPGRIFNQIVRLLGATYNHTQNVYTVDCNKTSPLILEINKGRAEIQLPAYTKKVNDQCILTLRPHEDPKSIVLGEAYFVYHGVCLDYRTEEVHFYNFGTQYVQEGVRETKEGGIIITKNRDH